MAATALVRTGHQLWLMMMLAIAFMGLVTLAMANNRVLIPVRNNN